MWSSLKPTLNANRHWIIIENLKIREIDSILELGVDDGATARMMLLNTYRPNPYYLVIDLFEQTYVEIYRDSLRDRPNHNKKKLERSLKLYSSNAALIAGDTSTTLRDMNPSSHKPYQLCFIDGDHSYEGVKKDFSACLPHLAEDALILIDDYTDSPEIPGVKKFVEELTRSEEFHVRVHHDPSDEYRGHKYKVATIEQKNKDIFII